MKYAASTNAVRGLLAVLPAALIAVSCARVETESKVDVRPIEVKPIHITVDVNVRVDRELDNFFAFEDQPASKPAGAPGPATQPTTAPAAATTTQTGA